LQLLVKAPMIGVELASVGAFKKTYMSASIHGMLVILNLRIF
jgi:hypothetical protein